MLAHPAVLSSYISSEVRCRISFEPPSRPGSVIGIALTDDTGNSSSSTFSAKGNVAGARRLKTKEIKLVDYNISADNPFSFLFGLTLTFQRRAN
ncbi:hypothetical protein [Parvibaculum sp.]|uniref:hypothetical protein n=1 Tax=Parvibaculum sp. TaxID=2024848 RepID=UPI000C53E1D7|nr:hypothetical protein [Parvibaculum sp.]MAM95150.1 hypothetical protein [Parvibaculum sp.]HCX66950.1 hypothetical protein [Rhodobiaceae bacterium]